MPDRVRSQFGNFFTNITTPAKHNGTAKAIMFPFKSPTYNEFKNIIAIPINAIIIEVSVIKFIFSFKKIKLNIVKKIT